MKRRSVLIGGSVLVIMGLLVGIAAIHMYQVTAGATGVYQVSITSDDGAVLIDGQMTITVTKVHWGISLTCPWVWTISRTQDVEAVCSLNGSPRWTELLESIRRPHLSDRAPNVFGVEEIDSTGCIWLELRPPTLDNYVSVNLHRDTTGYQGVLMRRTSTHHKPLGKLVLVRQSE